jgi:hypothetical protein
VAETKEYIVVQDLGKTKNMAIPDKVIRDYEYYFDIRKALACKAQEYEGVNYLILCKN